METSSFTAKGGEASDGNKCSGAPECREGTGDGTATGAFTYVGHGGRAAGDGSAKRGSVDFRTTQGASIIDRHTPRPKINTFL